MRHISKIFLGIVDVTEDNDRNIHRHWLHNFSFLDYFRHGIYVKVQLSLFGQWAT
jgi:hypothetical protein